MALSPWEGFMSEADARHVAMVQLIDEVAHGLGQATIAQVGAPDVLVARYLDHQHVDDLADIGSASLAAIIDAHVQVAASRAPGTQCVKSSPNATSTPPRSRKRANW